MDKKAFFQINDISLYEDIVLIELDTPILFVCKDDYNQRYLAVCIDMDMYEYYVMNITNELLINIIEGKTEIKEAFVQATSFFYVQAGDTIDNDLVRLLDKSELADDDYPDNGIYYTIKNSVIDEYIFRLKFHEIQIKASQFIRRPIKAELSSSFHFEVKPLIHEYHYLWDKQFIVNHKKNANQRKDYILNEKYSFTNQL